MLLRASSQAERKSVDINGVFDDTVRANVEHEEILRKIVDGVINRDDVAMPTIREEAVRTIGAQSLVDAIAVVSAFNAITRVADSTGIPLDESTETATEEMRVLHGINAYQTAEKSKRFDTVSAS